PPWPGNLGGSTRPSGDGTCRASWRTVIGARGREAGHGLRLVFGHAARIRSSRGTPPAASEERAGQSRVTTRGHSGRNGSLLSADRSGQSFLRTPTQITWRTLPRSGRGRRGAGRRDATSAPRGSRRARGRRPG